MHFSRFEKGVVVGFAVAGIGIAATAALAAECGVRKDPEEKEEEFSLQGMELQLPSMPSSMEELIEKWASGYEKFKRPLSTVFQIGGQILVAPIAMTIFDAAYLKYIEYVAETYDVQTLST